MINCIKNFGRSYQKIWIRVHLLVIITAITTILLLGATHSAQAADQALIDAARKEGRLTWYTTLVVGQVVRPMVAAFEAKYPGISVDFVSAPLQETVLRLLNEGRSHAMKGDVFDGGDTPFPLMEAGLVGAFKPEAALEYPADYKDPNGFWTANIVQVVTPSINTDLVDKADVPKTLTDLLDPKWRGKMAWTDSPSASGPPGFVGGILESMGQTKGMDYLQALAGQHIANVPVIQRVVLDQNIAGQYPLVLLVYNYHAAISMAQGAPIQWLPIFPILTFGTMGLMKDAPHPNAARLFVEFNLSAEGQRIYAQAGYIPANPAVDPTVESLKPGDGRYTPVLLSPAEFNKKKDEWIALYKRLFE